MLKYGFVPKRGVCVFLFIWVKMVMFYLDGNAYEVEHLTSHMAQMTKQKP